MGRIHGHCEGDSHGFSGFPFDSCLYRSGKHFYFSGKQQLCHEKAAAPQTNP